MISIIAPCRNEARFIDGFLDAVAGFEDPGEPFELLVVDGQSDDGTREALANAQVRLPWLQVINNPRRITPVAMNLGIAAAKGDYIVRMDIHADYPSDYLAKLIRWARETGADNVGGLCRTGLVVKTATARAIKKVFEDRLGVGNSLFRIGSAEVREVDTVPFGCYRREVFSTVGLFDERLVRVQDYEFNRRLKASGGRILLVPEIVCTYYPRSTYGALWENRFATGKGVVLLPYYIRSFRATGARHGVPLLFLLSLTVPLLAALFWAPAAVLTLVAGASYLAAIGARSLKLRDEQTPARHIMAAFGVLHLSYGSGSLAGIGSIIHMGLSRQRKESAEQ